MLAIYNNTKQEFQQIFLAIYNNSSNWEDNRANRWVSLDSELELGQGKTQDGGRT
jgi:hypothetical protein